MRIDLNADLGEGCGDDDALLDLVTSANIACGGHTGDESTMRATILSAQQRHVAIGAHPSYPDRANFGRTVMDRTPDQIERDVAEQLGAIGAVATSCGARLRHVKAHGALYNTAAFDYDIADAISRAVRAFDPSLAIVGLAGGAQIQSAKQHGLRAVAEVFADRRYDERGFLLPRSRPDALIEDTAQAVAQALRLIEEGRGETLCLHGDGPHAVEFARAIRRALQERSIDIAPFD